MKIIYRIARLELGTLFFSPIAWLLLIIFLFQTGLAYTNIVGGYVKVQELFGSAKSLEFLTTKVFGSPLGLWHGVISRLYLYLPLLTMGLISREMSSGTIKLLYSSPVKAYQVVAGKFLAMVAYNLLLVLVLAMYAVAGIFDIHSAEIGMLLSGLLGIFLLLCTYAAIGLFMSTLTAYQIVAAISTLAVFAALEYVDKLWRGVDIVRNITYFLSVSGRTNQMLVGLVNSKDLLYFLLITFMFLAFSVIKLQSDRETRSFLQVAGRYAGTFIGVLAIGYVSSQPGCIAYLDVTRDKTYTITPNTQKVLAAIGDDPLEVTFYVNLLDLNYGIGSPDARNTDRDRWSAYQRFKPDIRLNYVYYYAVPLDLMNNFKKLYPGKSVKEVARRYADAYKTDVDNFLPPAQINKIIDLKGERYRSVMQLKFKGKTTFLRLYNDMAVVPSEAEITAALKRLTVPLPRIGFLQEAYERSIDRLGPRDFGALVSDITFRNSLINQGFDAVHISLSGGEVPMDISALVIGDPRTAFSAEALAKIHRYIGRGGNLMLLAEADKKDVWKPVLDSLGVSIMDGQLLQYSKDYPRDMVVAVLTKAAAGLSGELAAPYRDSTGVNMPGVAALRYDARGPYHVTPLLVTDTSNTWIAKGPVVLDSATIEFLPAAGDSKSLASPLLALTRKVGGREQRIIVAGDADFLTTAAFARRKANFPFSTQLFRWFTYGEFPIDASRPLARDRSLDITRNGVSAERILFLWVLPAILLIFATILLVRRKRK